MTIETGIENAGVYIDALDDTYPADGDDLVEGDNHIRGIKNTLLNTFPNITGAVTPTHTELNYVDGVTSAIQTQLDAKINTTDNTQSIDASGTTNSQTFAFGSTSLNILSRVDIKTDSGVFRIDALGSTNSPAGAVNLANTGSGDLRLFTGGTLSAAILAAGGFTVSDDAPATPAANTLYADSMVKAWALVLFSGSTPSLTEDVNISGIVDNGVGDTTLTVATGFTGTGVAAEFSAVATILGNSHYAVGCPHSSLSGSIIVTTRDASAPVDASFNMIATGRQ